MLLANERKKIEFEYQSINDIWEKVNDAFPFESDVLGSSVIVVVNSDEKLKIQREIHDIIDIYYRYAPKKDDNFSLVEDDNLVFTMPDGRNLIVIMKEDGPYLKGADGIKCSNQDGWDGIDTKNNSSLAKLMKQKRRGR